MRNAPLASAKTTTSRLIHPPPKALIIRANNKIDVPGAAVVAPQSGLPAYQRSCRKAMPQ